LVHEKPWLSVWASTWSARRIAQQRREDVVIAHQPGIERLDFLEGQLTLQIFEHVGKPQLVRRCNLPRALTGGGCAQYGVTVVTEPVEEKHQRERQDQ
jgi:hypothetical protein